MATSIAQVGPFHPAIPAPGLYFGPKTCRVSLERWALSVPLFQAKGSPCRPLVSLSTNCSNLKMCIWSELVSLQLSASKSSHVLTCQPIGPAWADSSPSVVTDNDPTTPTFSDSLKIYGFLNHSLWSRFSGVLIALFWTCSTFKILCWDTGVPQCCHWCSVLQNIPFSLPLKLPIKTQLRMVLTALRTAVR